MDFGRHGKKAVEIRLVLWRPVFETLQDAVPCVVGSGGGPEGGGGGGIFFGRPERKSKEGQAAHFSPTG